MSVSSPSAVETKSNLEWIFVSIRATAVLKKHAYTIFTVSEETLPRLPLAATGFQLSVMPDVALNMAKLEVERDRWQRAAASTSDTWRLELIQEMQSRVEEA